MEASRAASRARACRRWLRIRLSVRERREHAADGQHQQAEPDHDDARKKQRGHQDPGNGEDLADYEDGDTGQPSESQER